MPSFWKSNIDSIETLNQFTKTGTPKHDLYLSQIAMKCSWWIDTFIVHNSTGSRKWIAQLDKRIQKIETKSNTRSLIKSLI